MNNRSNPRKDNNPGFEHRKEEYDPKGKYEKFFIELGQMTVFTKGVIKALFQPPFEHKELLKQSYLIGNKSLGLIGVTGFIMGLVITMQLHPNMSSFGAQTLIPSAISLAVVKELGPVIVGLICAGKISSGIAAEIAAMKVTEQIDAMEVSGTKPMSFVVASRVLAATLMVPLLIIFAIGFSYVGTYIGINFFEDLSLPLFISRSFNVMGYMDVFPGLIKSVFFGFFIGVIGSFKGYTSGLGTESVGYAANSAVVASSFTIFLIDLIFALIFSAL